MNLEGLKKEISLDLNENENLFLHGIQNAQDEYVEKIFELGLFCYKYFSTLITMKELGKLEDITSQSLDYTWCSFTSDYSVNVILAIPDYLTLDGKFLPIYPCDAYSKAKLDDDGGCRTFLDIILGNSSTIGTIPREFVYGAYLMRNDNKTVANLIYNPLHYTKLPRQEYANFFEKMKAKVEDTPLGKYLKDAPLEKLASLESNLKSALLLDEGKISYEAYLMMLKDLGLKKSNQR